MNTEKNQLEAQIRDCLESLEKTVNNFVSFFKNDKDYNQMVYTYWTVKDVLGHVTFWHESFAKHIFNTTVDEVPYKKGSRNYSRLEHLQVVHSHIEKHLRDINNKLKQEHVKANKQKGFINFKSK